MTPTPLSTAGQQDCGAPSAPSHPAISLCTQHSHPQHGPQTHPVDEDIFGEHSLGVLDAAEAIHHLLNLKVAGKLQQTSTWHSTVSPRAPSTRNR